MILVERKEDCCGCTACASICSHNAITLKPDDLGFLYPEVDQSLCTGCGLCEKVCAFQNGYDVTDTFREPQVFAVRHKNIREVETSRSGAMFIALSDEILDNRGVVYGVGYKEHFRVVHKRATTKEERNEFKGSKYVQSDLGGVFKQVKNDLKKGLQVMFSGTPCQTAGLNEFVGKKLRSNLFLVDIVCHGVPSPYIWRDYLSYIEKKYDGKVIKVDFRDKSLGWNTHVESFEFDGGRKFILNTYSDLFQKCIMMRPSCGNCKYTNTQRPSDITIADYWGWEKTDVNFNADNKGCSLVFVNSEKGIGVWNRINFKLHYIPTGLSKCMQPNLQYPTVLSKYTEVFAQRYSDKGFVSVARRYGDMGWRYIYHKGKNKIKRGIKKVITCIV